MIPLYSNQQVREIDFYSINELGYPGSVLMENAAINSYRTITEHFDISNGIIGIVCGKGNNGGDGFAIARHFANNGYFVKALLISSINEIKGDARLNFDILDNISKRNSNIVIRNLNDIKDIKFLNDCDIIIDAILGSGSTGELNNHLKAVIDSLNSINSAKVAIDIPTGLNANTGFGDVVFNSDLTICLGELKPGLFFGAGYKFAGKVVKGDIGIDFEYYRRYNSKEYLVEPEDAVEGLPVRSKTAHKYSSGKVLVIAGSEKYPGAAYLCTNSSLISGAGATVLAVPDSIKSLVFPNLFESTMITYNQNNKGYLTVDALDTLNEKIEWADIVALGCGIGRDEETVEACGSIVKNFPNTSFVIDADAIYCIAQYGLEKLDLRNIIFTPHLAEFSYLCNVGIEELSKDLLLYGREFVSKTGSYLVLKGSPTIVFNPEGEVFINTCGNSGMAKFGTGDVLTGFIASLVAQSKNIEKSIISSVYLHSLSADLLLDEKTEFGLTARDILNNLPKTIKFLRDSIV